MLWETAGKERFKSLVKSFFHGAYGIIFVYDIINKQSFEGFKNWIKDSESNGKFKAIICGNKSDLE